MRALILKEACPSQVISITLVLSQVAFLDKGGKFRYASEVKMPKEVIAAIVVGGVLGILIAFGIWRAQDTLVNNRQDNQTQTSPTPAPSPTELGLTITSPEDEMVVETSKITVSGKTISLATVVITSSAGETIIDANSDGSFSAEIELNAGVNTIVVLAISEDGEAIEKELTVVYSTELQ